MPQRAKACACKSIEMVKGASTKAEAAADTAVSENTTDKSTGTIVLFSLTVAALAYIITRRRRNIIKI